MSKRTPTYSQNGEIRPMCADCKYKTSWAFILECKKCRSYLCNICYPICKNCK